MEIALIIIAFIFLIVGLLGSVIPALPGPPISYIGLLLLQWSGRGSFNPVFLWVWAGITVIVVLADNFLPAWMTKKFGGSKIAVTGSVLGLIIGMIFFAPIGLLVGPFAGALAGELISNAIKARRKKEPDAPKTKPLKVALGAFLAFILGTGAKLIICSLMIYYAVKAVFGFS